MTVCYHDWTRFCYVWMEFDRSKYLGQSGIWPSLNGGLQTASPWIQPGQQHRFPSPPSGQALGDSSSATSTKYTVSLSAERAVVNVVNSNSSQLKNSENIQTFETLFNKSRRKRIRRKENRKIEIKMKEKEHSLKFLGNNVNSLV